MGPPECCIPLEVQLVMNLSKSSPGVQRNQIKKEKHIKTMKMKKRAIGTLLFLIYHFEQASWIQSLSTMRVVGSALQAEC